VRDRRMGKTRGGQQTRLQRNRRAAVAHWVRSYKNVPVQLDVQTAKGWQPGSMQAWWSA